MKGDFWFSSSDLAWVCPRRWRSWGCTPHNPITPTVCFTSEGGCSQWRLPFSQIHHIDRAERSITPDMRKQRDD